MRTVDVRSIPVASKCTFEWAEPEYSAGVRANPGIQPRWSRPVVRTGHFTLCQRSIDFRSFGPLEADGVGRQPTSSHRTLSPMTPRSLSDKTPSAKFSGKRSASQLKLRPTVTDSIVCRCGHSPRLHEIAPCDSLARGYFYVQNEHFACFSASLSGSAIGLYRTLPRK